MKRMLIAVLGLACVCALSINAVAKDKLTAEQKAVKKEMLDKYDTNKDGKLDKEELAKMTKDDKAKWEQAGLGKKKEAKAEEKTEKN
jgi:Ca2+-binding EF-hand superfamily protein